MSPSESRRQTAASAADALLSARPISALVGFDGFLDSIVDVVDRRHSMASRDYDPIATMEAFAERVRRSAGLSMNLELVRREERFGGNGPLMAGGLASLGASVTYIGGVGKDDEPHILHPAYAPFAARCREVMPIASTARTDALEFLDGKVMFNKPAPMEAVTWANILARVGVDAVRARTAAADLLAIVNWSIVPGVEGIWEGFVRDIFPVARPRRIFLDLSDPAKRTDQDIARALELIARLDRHAPVTLGLNLSEATRLAQVCGVAPPARGPALIGAAQALRSRIDVDCIIIHPREGAAASTRDGVSGWCDGPFTPRPALSTGAGDHFNAGVALAQCAGLTLPQVLAVGVATSGAYVRDAASASLARLVEFLRALPEPQAP